MDVELMMMMSDEIYRRQDSNVCGHLANEN